MINGVLAPTYFLKKLVADVSVSKYLGVVIRYFSDTKQTIINISGTC